MVPAGEGTNGVADLTLQRHGTIVSRTARRSRRRLGQDDQVQPEPGVKLSRPLGHCIDQAAQLVQPFRQPRVLSKRSEDRRPHDRLARRAIGFRAVLPRHGLSGLRVHDDTGQPERHKSERQQ